RRLLRKVEVEGPVYSNFTKAQIFVNGLHLKYYIHVSALTPANLPDAYSFHVPTPSYNLNGPAASYISSLPYDNSSFSVNLLTPTNLTEAAIYKLTKVVNTIMSQ
ncbi:8676_t:CDS:2, partial [Diversispora eburnea]